MALRGIGTLCDIAEYDDGYLLLTHTGLYILDENFANRRSAGEEWEKLFATRDDEGFWERVWLNQDQKERLFKNLTVTPQGIFFFCAVRPDSFMNGDWYWGHRERPAEESTASDGVHIPAYFGMEYVASWGGSLYGISGYLLYRDGEYLCEAAPMGWDCKFLLLGDEQYIYAEEFYGDKTALYRLTEDGTVTRVASGWGRFLAYDCDGAYCYYVYVDKDGSRLMRTDGERSEVLNCLAVANASGIIRLIVKDESHVLFMTDSGHIEIAEFSVKSN